MTKASATTVVDTAPKMSAMAMAILAASKKADPKNTVAANAVRWVGKQYGGMAPRQSFNDGRVTGTIDAVSARMAFLEDVATRNGFTPEEIAVLYPTV